MDNREEKHKKEIRDLFLELVAEERRIVAIKEFFMKDFCGHDKFVYVNTLS